MKRKPYIYLIVLLILIAIPVGYWYYQSLHSEKIQRQYVERMQIKQKLSQLCLAIFESQESSIDKAKASAASDGFIALLESDRLLIKHPTENNSGQCVISIENGEISGEFEMQN